MSGRVMNMGGGESGRSGQGADAVIEQFNSFFKMGVRALTLALMMVWSFVLTQVRRVSLVFRSIESGAIVRRYKTTKTPRNAETDTAIVRALRTAGVFVANAGAGCGTAGASYLTLQDVLLGRDEGGRAAGLWGRCLGAAGHIVRARATATGGVEALVVVNSGGGASASSSWQAVQGAAGGLTVGGVAVSASLERTCSACGKPCGIFGHVIAADGSCHCRSCSKCANCQRAVRPGCAVGKDGRCVCPRRGCSAAASYASELQTAVDAFGRSGRSSVPERDRRAKARNCRVMAKLVGLELSESACNVRARGVKRLADIRYTENRATELELKWAEWARRQDGGGGGGGSNDGASSSGTDGSDDGAAPLFSPALAVSAAAVQQLHADGADAPGIRAALAEFVDGAAEFASAAVAAIAAVLRRSPPPPPSASDASTDWGGAAALGLALLTPAERRAEAAAAAAVAAASSAAAATGAAADALLAGDGAGTSIAATVCAAATAQDAQAALAAVLQDQAAMQGGGSRASNLLDNMGGSGERALAELDDGDGGGRDDGGSSSSSDSDSDSESGG
jgi:hypothetical protein